MVQIQLAGPGLGAGEDQGPGTLLRKYGWCHLWLMEKVEPRVQVRAVVSLRLLPFWIIVSPQAR